jgi:uncharacterized protein YdhG (YjbR/CyaY superfamily)
MEISGRGDDMGSVDDYVGRFDGDKKEWLTTMIGYMRKNHPSLEEIISYQIPTYKFDGQYIAFSVAKEHFTFHTLDFEVIEELKSLLPKAKFGKGSAKVPFSDRAAIPVLFEACERIIERSSHRRGAHKVMKS